jgi:hypothetical protein
MFDCLMIKIKLAEEANAGPACHALVKTRSVTLNESCLDFVLPLFFTTSHQKIIPAKRTIASFASYILLFKNEECITVLLPQ